MQVFCYQASGYCSGRNFRIACVPSLFSVNSLTPVPPVAGFLWHVASVASGNLLPASSTICRLPQSLPFRGDHIHHLVSARILRCLRFTFQATWENAILAIRWRWLRLPEQDLHRQDKCGFSQRTAQWNENSR